MEEYKKNITVVLTSHKSGEKVLNFINNFEKDTKILIIDNSNDHELEKKVEDKNNVTIHLTENKGYGSAINFARTKINSKYFFILSPDLKNINEKFLEEFYLNIKKVKNIGAIGPRFINVEEKSHKQSDKRKVIGQVKSINGSAMLFDTKMFDKIGGFDENFFLFWEETDYCKRARNKGYKIYQFNKLKIEHKRGVKSGVVNIKTEDIEKYENFYTWHFIWSKYYFFKKHYGIIITSIYFFPIIIRLLIRILIYKMNNDKKKLTKYKNRLDGLFTSLKGKKSINRI